MCMIYCSSQILPADEVVALMVDHMTSSKPGYNYFQPTPGIHGPLSLWYYNNVPSIKHAGEEVCLVVNNLGGTSNLELSIMAGSTIRYLG